MSARMNELLAIMARLRAPGGCPWDREQTFASIAPFTIEEAYEVADAIERGDRQQLKDELGDLLFQVVFHAQMAREAGDFDFEAVVKRSRKVAARSNSIAWEAWSISAASSCCTVAALPERKAFACATSCA